MIVKFTIELSKQAFKQKEPEQYLSEGTRVSEEKYWRLSISTGQNKKQCI